MAVNFEYYRIFYYVAKYRNLTRAAAVMSSSQPNVTRVMNQLEHDLGCQLMIRSNKGITLTTEGEELYVHVAAAFEQLQLGEAKVGQNAGLEGGMISIGASEMAMHLCLLEKLKLFHETYPDVRLKIHNCTTPQALTSLKSGYIDFAVVTMPSGWGTSYKKIPLKSFQDVLAGGPQFSAFSDKEFSLSELSECSLITLGKYTSTYEFYNQFYLNSGFMLEPDIEVATADLLLPMIKNGLGIGFLPRELAEPSLRKKEIFEIHLNETLPEREVCLIYDKKRGFGVAARKLREMLEG
ncbi:MAG: LysR family transcriptional regulator [Lachnospiraceae bacterium]